MTIISAIKKNPEMIEELLPYYMERLDHYASKDWYHARIKYDLKWRRHVLEFCKRNQTALGYSFRERLFGSLDMWVHKWRYIRQITDVCYGRCRVIEGMV